MPEPAGVNQRPLWICPSCGHAFVTANIWHSCTSIGLDDAFAGSRPEVRAAFDVFVDLIARCGPLTVIALKSRIVVMARVRFAEATVRRDRLVANFALPRRLDDPRYRIEAYNQHWIAHRFDVRSPRDLDIPGLPDLLCESYRELGMQAALARHRAAAVSGSGCSRRRACRCGRSAPGSGA